jgi:hypothetical protein
MKSGGLGITTVANDPRDRQHRLEGINSARANINKALVEPCRFCFVLRLQTAGSPAQQLTAGPVQEKSYQHGLAQQSHYHEFYIRRSVMAASGDAGCQELAAVHHTRRTQGVPLCQGPQQVSMVCLRTK